MPIVYYLAPSERYPDAVASIRNGRGAERTEVRRDLNQSVALFMNQLLNEAREKGLYPRNLDPWNEELERAARAFHASIADKPQFCRENCTVFWSDSKEPTALTAGKVSIGRFLNPKQTNINPDSDTYLPPAPNPTLFVNYYDVTRGDGTVPVVSQRADFDNSALIPIPERPSHVPSPNTPSVWKKIIEVLVKSAGRR